MKTSTTSRFLRISLPLLALLGLGAAGTISARATTHAVTPARLGVVRSSHDMEAILDTPGPITVETVVGADWQIDRSGLINLAHPKARAAHLVDGLEPIQIYFHALRHPTRGLYLVDTGVERALARDPEHAALHGLVARAAHADRMVVRHDTASWLEAQPTKLAGVFLTHLHLDHITGMPDVPADVPIYVGPGEATSRGAMNLVTQSIVDAELAGHAPLREWQFRPDPSGTFDGVLDVFGDGSLWAIEVPGHTHGSTAYLARTEAGPVLLVGDVSHTAWGWENDVEPGTFTEDAQAGIESLARLRALVARHPSIDVRLGHQSLR